MSEDARIIKHSTIAKSRWLSFESIEWKTPSGESHEWECVSRVGNTSCVMLIATLVPSGRIVLIRQFRPPLGEDCLEFPAGLIDEGEDPSEAALRELQEETGYQGCVRSVSPLSSVSAGLTREKIYVVQVDIDEEYPENKNPQQELEGTEDIEVILVNLSDLPRMIRESSILVDAKLHTFVLGLGALSQ